jgi:hypothetical protein
MMDSCVEKNTVSFDGRKFRQTEGTQALDTDVFSSNSKYRINSSVKILLPPMQEMFPNHQITISNYLEQTIIHKTF